MHDRKITKFDLQRPWCPNGWRSGWTLTPHALGKSRLRADDLGLLMAGNLTSADRG